MLNLSKVNDKEIILKSAKKKMNGNLQRNPHKAITRFVSRNPTVQEWNDIIKILKDKSSHPTMLYLEKLSFLYEG